MANRWETIKTVRDFILEGSKVTTDGDGSHEIIQHLFLGWKVMTKLDSILKSRDITLPTKARLVKAIVFSVVMCEHESWTIKKAEWWRIDAFKLWCWRRFLGLLGVESPLDCKEIQPVHPKGNQSWVFIGKTDAEAETPMLWAPDVKNWLMGEDPDSGKNWRQEEKGMIEDDMVGWHHDSMVMCLTKLWGVVMDMEAWDTAVHGVTKSHTWQSSWTELRDRLTTTKKKNWSILIRGFKSPPCLNREQKS